MCHTASWLGVLLCSVEGVTAVSEHEAVLMEAAFGILPEVIPNGLDIEAVRRGGADPF